MRPLLRTLSLLSVLELISVVVLLGNAVTVHDRAVTSALGPIHGALYLAVAVTALLGRGLGTRTRVLALIPLLSGPLTMRQVWREAQAVPSENTTSG
ncbi:hypothetical protein GEV27_10225 [Aeromicrobium sp. S22]|uniref:hypothetical protein n=1 Tax=Aeromicrobium sp. S22 TaxID=2662029 RepID=UPI0013C1748D|nr:hypothetical protein [Aeromicrobium sp. S22]MRK01898.1 hypothetical protein [Aeromicrobium sp. S22]